MSDETETVQAGPVVKVARDLTEIERLHGFLDPQAATQSRAKVDGTSLPGGRAMVALSPVGSPDEWAEQIAYEELQHLATCLRPHHRDCRYAEHAADGEDDVSPLQTLLFWSEQWRLEKGYPLEGRRPTEATEANLIRSLLGWAWENELHWDDFASDVKHVRLQMENILYAGDRVDRTRVMCNRPTCEPRPDADGNLRKPRLIKLTTTEEEGERWKCPGCRARYTADDFRSAHAEQLRSEGAEKYVLLPDAIGTLRAQGRADRTIRKWLEPPIKDACTECRRTWPHQEYATCPAMRGKPGRRHPCGGELAPKVAGESVVMGYCELGTRRTMVWWPDLWRLHLLTLTRRRAA